jgi:hypothetical protein
MASLLQWLHFSGARDATGAPVASGLAYFYQPGSTSVAVQVYADAAEVGVLTQPISLDAAGRAEVYLADQAEVIIKTAAGATVKLTTNANGIDPHLVNVEWDGTPTTLQNALDYAKGEIDGETYTIKTSASTTPSFEVDPTVRNNVFILTGVSITHITLTWPSPAPTLSAGAAFTLYFQFATGSSVVGSSASFDLTLGANILQAAGDGDLEALLYTPGLTTPRTWIAQFRKTHGTYGQFMQISPWVDVAYEPWGA